MKVIYNACFGGFGFSDEAEQYFSVHGVADHQLTTFEEERTNPIRVEYVESHINTVSDGFAKLRIAEIPDNATDWWIDEYDGLESVWYVLDGKRWRAQRVKGV